MTRPSRPLATAAQRCPTCHRPWDPRHISGRPDIGGNGSRDFGKTNLKRFAPFVYSLLGGMLVHRVLGVEAQWYQPANAGTCLERVASPRLTIRTACGQSFYAGQGLKRARACALPKPEAVPCGRCSGTGPVFGRGLAERTVKRREARARIGCVMEVD